MSDASERANARASDPVLHSVLLLVLAHIALAAYLGTERNESSYELVSNQVWMIGKPVRSVRSVFAGLAANLVDRRLVRRQVRANHETLGRGGGEEE